VTDPDDETPYTLKTTPTVRRQLTEELPESVAAAALEFITGPLLDNPRRVGKPLAAPLQDRRSARRGTYRIIHRIENDSRIVTVLLVTHRRDAYRPR
jgi:mRNA interferase RelE/StbE